MAKSFFREKGAAPNADRVVSALKGAGVYWEKLAAHVLEIYPSPEQKWKYYGSAWGWCLVLSSKKKKLVYLTPGEGQLLCSFIFSEKGRQMARQAGLAGDVLQTMEAGKDNPAGHAFDIPVADDEGLALAKRLIEIRARS